MDSDAGVSGFAGPYRLAILGRVELTSVHGEEVSLPRGKPMALLIYLTLHRGSVEREELADLLWGDGDGPRGRQSVRQALSQIRKDLGAEVFKSEDPVELVTGVVQTDLDELREAVEGGAVESARALWRGEPLSGLSVGEEGWEGWAEEVGDRAKRILVSGLEEAAVRRIRDGEVVEGVEELRRAALMVPERVEGWVSLIESQIDHGRIRGARTSLADAWGHLDPDLYEERLGPLERRVSLGPDAALVDEGGAIVGRESDVGAVSLAWRRALERGTEILFFEGQEGYGKTRLLQEITKPIVAPGAQVAGASSGEPVAWGAAGGWIRTLGELEGADRVLPESARTLAAFLEVGGGEEAALADAFLDLLCSVALAHPTLLTVDDAQRVEPESWRLLRRLVRLRPGVPLLICLGWDAARSGEEARRDVEDWVGEGWVELRRLRPFTLEEVESLIRIRGWRHDGAVKEAGEQVFEQSGGHPELVFGFLKVLDENPLRPSPLSDAPPSLPELTSLPLSEPLEEYFRKKLDDLPDSAHHLVRVLGDTDHATIRTLEYSSGLGVAEIQTLISELKARGIVEEKEEGVGLVNRSMAALARDTAPVPRVIGAPREEPELDPYAPPEGSALVDLAFRRTLITWTGSAAVIVVVLLIVWFLFLR